MRNITILISGNLWTKSTKINHLMETLSKNKALNTSEVFNDQPNNDYRLWIHFASKWQSTRKMHTTQFFSLSVTRKQITVQQIKNTKICWKWQNNNMHNVWNFCFIFLYFLFIVFILWRTSYRFSKRKHNNCSSCYWALWWSQSLCGVCNSIVSNCNTTYIANKYFW